jgi:hypothetical protein
MNFRYSVYPTVPMPGSIRARSQSEIKVVYEIPFSFHFNEYEAPHPLDNIEADID